MPTNKSIDKDLLEHLYECSNICLLDESYSITYCNKNFNSLTGYNDNELNGINILDITNHDQSNNIYNFLVDTIKNGEIWKGELQFKHKNNQLVWLDSIIKPIFSKTKKTRYLASFIDISQQKQLTDNVKQRSHRQCLIAILGQISLNNIPVQELIEQTLSVVCGSLSVNIGIIIEINQQDNNAIIRSNYNGSTNISDNTSLIVNKNNILGKALRSSQPIHCSSLSNEDRFTIPDELLHEDSNSGIFFIIGEKKSPFGIFALLSKTPKTLNIDETYFLQAICNIIAEASNRQLAEQNLRYERELSRSYLNVAEVIILVVDKEKKIILINNYASMTLGYAQEELNGLNFIEKLIPEKYKKSAIEKFDNILSNTNMSDGTSHTYDNVSSIITKQNDIRYIRWRSSSLMDDTNIDYILFAGEDITEILKHEEEEKHLQKLLYQAQKTEAVGMLAGSIAHDFNNILTSILGFTELALDNKSNKPDKLHKYLKRIQASAIKARNIIEQMQSINLQNDTPNNAILLPSLLKSSLQMLHSTLSQSIVIQTDISNNMPAVKINAPKFNQMLMHLLSNASTALNGEGNIKISLKIEDIINSQCNSCNKMINDKYVVLTIHDNGPGISIMTLNDIFSKPDSEHTSGLPFISHITHEKDGHIIISNIKLNKNEESTGTCIKLLFKIVKHESDNDHHQKKSIDFSEIQQKHIIIVDDESTLASYLGELLNSAGFISHVFSDPVEAFREFEKSPDDIDLIISDQTMPVLTGDELAKKIIHIRPDLPIIIINGQEDLLTNEVASDLQIQALFKKPVDSAELLHTVVSLLIKD